ncbi:MAG TPA: hypothetical protein VMH04_21695 [Candidatus Solibacter sp.]|nr:hypothetical protein [Candidatus Solibacter sp.]
MRLSQQSVLPLFVLVIFLSLTGCGVPMQPVSSSSLSAITARSDDALADQPVTAEYSVVVSPTTVSIAAGSSGSVKATTTVQSGYDHALQVSFGNLPVGVTVKLAPKVIPAPGAGTSNATITVSSSVPAGSYTLHVKATDGVTTAKTTVTLKVTSSSSNGVTFKGCWYKQNGHRYQAVDVTVKSSGTYAFDAVLYSGTTCSTWADEFGFGQNLNLGGSYTFWFTDFADQTDMSALWHVGSNVSQCVSYATAPDC